MKFRQIVGWVLARMFEVDVVPFDGRPRSDWYVRLDRGLMRRSGVSPWTEPR